MRMRHITLRVKDLEKSIKFYEEIAGLDLVRRFQAGEYELAFMSNGEGETQLEFVYSQGGETFQGKGIFLCFETENLEGMHEFAENMEYNPSDIHDPGDQSSYFYVYDPDGVSIQLRTFPDE
ncbi:MAG: VOC family protein [Anaerovoracaceae bacterium]